MIILFCLQKILPESGHKFGLKTDPFRFFTVSPSNRWLPSWLPLYCNWRYLGLGEYHDGGKDYVDSYLGLHLSFHFNFLTFSVCFSIFSPLIWLDNKQSCPILLPKLIIQKSNKNLSTLAGGSRWLDVDSEKRTWWWFELYWKWHHYQGDEKKDEEDRGETWWGNQERIQSHVCMYESLTSILVFLSFFPTVYMYVCVCMNVLHDKTRLCC